MPFVPLLPAIGIQFNFILCAGLDALTWTYFLVFVLIGLVIYFGYSIRHSHLEPNNVLRGKLETSIVETDAPMQASLIDASRDEQLLGN